MNNLVTAVLAVKAVAADVTAAMVDMVILVVVAVTVAMQLNYLLPVVMAVITGILMGDTAICPLWVEKGNGVLTVKTVIVEHTIRVIRTIPEISK